MVQHGSLGLTETSDLTLEKLFHLRAIEVFSPQGEPASHSEILLFQPFIFFIDHSKTIVTVTRLKRWHKLSWEERVRKDRVTTSAVPAISPGDKCADPCLRFHSALNAELAALSCFFTSLWR